MFGFGRKHQQEPQPNYSAIIEAAEERAQRSVIAWASEQESWADEESDEEEDLEDEMYGFEPYDPEQVSLFDLYTFFVRGE